MKKIVFAVLIAFFLSAVVLLATAARFNFRDQSLSDQVKWSIGREPTYTNNREPAFNANRNRAFYFAVGLYSGETQDPAAKGEQLYKKLLSLSVSRQSSFWRGQVLRTYPWDDGFQGCKTPSGVCTLEFVEQHPETLEALKENPAALKNYIRMMEYGAGADFFMGTPGVPLSGIRMFSLGLHRKMLLQLAQWAQDGRPENAIKLIEASNWFNQDQVASGTLEARMVAEQEIISNGEFITDLFKRYPKLHSYRELQDSFLVPDGATVLHGAIVRDLSMLDSFVQNPRLGVFEPNPVWHLLANLFPAVFFLRPKETLNNYYDFASAEAEGKSHRQMKHLTWPDSWLDNPIGRKLIALRIAGLRGQLNELNENAEKIESIRGAVADISRDGG